MAGQDYTLIIKIDDSQLQRQIEKLQGIFTGGGSSSSQSPITKQTAAGVAAMKNVSSKMDAMSKMWKQYGEHIASIAKNTLALVGIGTSAAAILALLTQSSPILQSQFKILEQMMTLVLRPFGNFLGMILRPVMILLLRNVIIPFSKFMDSQGVKEGGRIGSNILNPLNPTPNVVPTNNANSPAAQEQAAAANFFGGIVDRLKNFIDSLTGVQTAFADTGTAAQTFMDKLKTSAQNTFGALNKNIAQQQQMGMNGVGYIDNIAKTLGLTQANALDMLIAAQKAKVDELKKSADAAWKQFQSLSAGGAMWYVTEAAAAAAKVKSDAVAQAQSVLDSLTGASKSMMAGDSSGLVDIWTNTQGGFYNPATGGAGNMGAVANGYTSMTPTQQAAAVAAQTQQQISAYNAAKNAGLLNPFTSRPSPTTAPSGGYTGISAGLAGNRVTQAQLDTAATRAGTTATSRYGANYFGNRSSTPDTSSQAYNSSVAGSGSGAAARAILYGMAGGGMITEPILGVGKSGKHYAFGEAGSEMVIPSGKGLGNIAVNINVDKMVSTIDINQLIEKAKQALRDTLNRRGIV